MMPLMFEQAAQSLVQENLNPRVMVDCSHANANKGLYPSDDRAGGCCRPTPVRGRGTYSG